MPQVFLPVQPDRRHIRAPLHINRLAEMYRWWIRRLPAKTISPYSIGYTLKLVWIAFGRPFEIRRTVSESQNLCSKRVECHWCYTKPWPIVPDPSRMPNRLYCARRSLREFHSVWCPSPSLPTTDHRSKSPAPTTAMWMENMHRPIDTWCPCQTDAAPIQQEPS